jgi:hypothetical protein
VVGVERVYIAGLGFAIIIIYRDSKIKCTRNRMLSNLYRIVNLGNPSKY